jgi:hypothetical protein
MMPNYGAKVSSAYIDADAIRGFLAELPSAMREIYGDQSLTVMYGWASNLHSDLQYVPMEWPLDLFKFFLEDSIDQRIFVVGGSDLHIRTPNSTLEVLICHESDIHLDGDDHDAIQKVVARFPQLDFRTAAEWKRVHQESERPDLSKEG